MERLLGILRHAGTNIKVLHLSGDSFDSGELSTLLQTVGPTLEQLKIMETRCNDGKWYEVLKIVKELRLKSLELRTLRSPYGGTSGVVSVQDEGKRICKGFKGEKGFEHYQITYLSAFMLGTQAVEAGLEVVLDYLATHPQTGM